MLVTRLPQSVEERGRPAPPLHDARPNVAGMLVLQDEHARARWMGPKSR
jgi:hypothetical protein